MKQIRLASVGLGLWALLGGCAHPAKLSTHLEIGSPMANITVVTLQVKNQENRATTPLLIDVTLRFRQGSEWGKPMSVIHPVGFVLNKHEEQILRSTVKVKGEAVRATLTIKEQETGKVVASEVKEWSSTAANSGPATRPLPGR